MHRKRCPGRPPSRRALVALGAAAVITASGGCESGAARGGGGGALRVGIPPDAVMVREVSHWATYEVGRPGQIYLYNVTRGRTVERYQVRPGQQFAVNA